MQSAGDYEVHEDTHRVGQQCIFLHFRVLWASQEIGQ